MLRCYLFTASHHFIYFSVQFLLNGWINAQVIQQVVNGCGSLVSTPAIKKSVIRPTMSLVLMPYLSFRTKNSFKIVCLSLLFLRSS
ncbi:hypothetical protein BpHYR1_009047 [Brachionus plicatilis]|uniref:Uncharacterized protein n=1 Tax=Brachionus plicatilis TaxID=10195 RepID=A0A3M7SV39_BRAPC|nr:hypothetical protein BpHYR1_009047 [Brachionus plicatilis]